MHKNILDILYILWNIYCIFLCRFYQRVITAIDYSRCDGLTVVTIGPET